MKNYSVLTVFLVLSLVVIFSFGAELEVKKTDLTKGIDQNNSSRLKDNSIVKPSEPKSVPKVDRVKKGSGDQGGIKNDPLVGSSSEESGSNESSKMGTNKEDDSSKKSQVNKEDKTKLIDGSESGKKGPKEKGTKEEGDSVLSKPMNKEEGAWGEECHSSNKCTDEKNELIACLRVPGNESPDLSLLIQNKGTSPLTVKISAPDFVHLEKTSVGLQEKEDKKLKVSIGKDNNKNTLIVLTAKNGDCSIDFGDLLLHNSGQKKIDYTAKSTYTNFLKKSPSIAYMSIAAVLLIASALMCARLWRKHHCSDSSKYQKLETELPICGGGKTEPEVTDGWDNSWGDSWDDEEAPRTPSKPVTPSLSSKGLASRRFPKDGWKD